MKHRPIAYCTNVHVATDLDSIQANLQQYAVAARDIALPDQPIGVGLWLSEQAAQQVDSPGCAAALAGWLADRELLPLTFNAFPQMDFHQPVVKHAVYRPTWADQRRLDYTLCIARILDRVLPPGVDGTISTLPLGWPSAETGPSFLAACAANLHRCAQCLDELAQISGRKMRLCLEPEPGCLLRRSQDVVEFFQRYLPAANGLAPVFLGVCHDICHSAVMFEPQLDALQNYHRAGIAVGKVQVSSALQADFAQAGAAAADLAQQLAAFAEPRYLHQTVIESAAGQTVFFEDLAPALTHNAGHLDGVWRIHFHLPIYLRQVGALQTTQQQILDCLQALCRLGIEAELEIETYTWDVSPPNVRSLSLAESIAAEIEWLGDVLEQTPES